MILRLVVMLLENIHTLFIVTKSLTPSRYMHNSSVPIKRDVLQSTTYEVLFSFANSLDYSSSSTSSQREAVCFGGNQIDRCYALYMYTCTRR